MIEWDLLILIFLSLLAAVMTAIVAWRYRGKFVPVGWIAFLAMTAGSIAVTALYVQVAYVEYTGISKVFLLPMLRFLFGFLMLSTALLAASVLLVRPFDE